MATPHDPRRGFLAQAARLFAIAAESEVLDLIDRAATLLGETSDRYRELRHFGIEAHADVDHAQRLAKAALRARRLELANESDAIIRHMPAPHDATIPLPGGRRALIGCSHDFGPVDFPPVDD